MNPHYNTLVGGSDGQPMDLAHQQYSSLVPRFAAPTMYPDNQLHGTRDEGAAGPFGHPAYHQDYSPVPESTATAGYVMSQQHATHGGGSSGLSIDSTNLEYHSPDGTSAGPPIDSSPYRYAPRLSTSTALPLHGCVILTTGKWDDSGALHQRFLPLANHLKNVNNPEIYEKITHAALCSLVRQLGATHRDTCGESVTHLVTNLIEFEKENKSKTIQAIINLANRKPIRVVTLDWLLDCAEHGKRLPEHKYLLCNQVEVSHGAGNAEDSVEHSKKPRLVGMALPPDDSPGMDYTACPQNDGKLGLSRAQDHKPGMDDLASPSLNKA